MTVFDEIGKGYRERRLPDPRISSLILEAIGSSSSVLNVGAGTGSYEPALIPTVAAEPSVVMIRQRPPGSAPCVQAAAEALPFRAASFDACLAILTIHHWSDLGRGLAEMRRVARGPIVILTWDPEFRPDFWLTRDYLPEIFDLDCPRFPTLAALAEWLGPLHVRPVLVPEDCVDGFLGAYWKRPRAYLDPAVQKSISAFAQLNRDLVDRALTKLARDLESGEWSSRNVGLRDQTAIDLGYRIVVARTNPTPSGDAA